MNRSTEKQIQKWCEDSGWTELFVQKGQFYAFPPGAVMALPVSSETIEKAKIAQRTKTHSLNQLLFAIVLSFTVIILNVFFGLPLGLSIILSILLSLFVILDISRIENLW